uniref:Uncharacterized protein n=1 Tax=Leersia perrieri TaxID=77586 RepID=A0A0D9VXU5_9ORYZ
MPLSVDWIRSQLARYDAVQVQITKPAMKLTVPSQHWVRSNKALPNN